MTIGIKTIVMTKKINFRCCAEEKIRRRRQLLSLLIQIKRKLKRRRRHQGRTLDLRPSFPLDVRWTSVGRASDVRQTSTFSYS